MKKIVAIGLSLLLGCSSVQITSSHYTPPEPDRIFSRLEQQKPGKHVALLIGANTELRHRNNLSLAYQVLIEQGYKRENIFILDSEGGNPVIYPITDTLTRKTLRIMFDWLNENLSESDTFLLYVTGHGQKTFLPLNRGERISKTNFMSHLRTLKVRSGIVVYSQCYWGSPNIESPYVFISATSEARTSYGDSFSRIFWEAFRRLQGNVSVLRAFEFARENDSGYLHGHQIPEISYSKVNPSEINLLGELTNDSR